MKLLDISKYLKSPNKGKGKCKRCHKSCLWSRDRVEMHIRNCDMFSDEEKLMFPTKLQAASNSSSNMEIQPSPADLPSDVSQVCLKEAVANFIFKSGVSFRAVELDCFKEIFSTINPALVDAIPSRKELSTQLLNNAYNRIQQQLHNILAHSTNLSLISDGWTNVSGEHLVNFCIKAPEMSTFFYKSIDTSRMAQTSEEIAFQITKVIDELGPQNFVCVVTDNASNMRGAWNLIEAAYPHIACNGCSAHMVNLLISDILHLETFANTVKDAQKIIKFVRNHAIVKAKYDEIRKDLNVKKKLSMPVSTRWYSHYNSIKNLIDSKYVLIKLVDMHKDQLKEINPKEASKDVIKLIERNSFWDKSSKLASIIEYPTNIIGKLEKDDSNLNEVYDYFGKMYMHFQHDKIIQRLVKYRWDFVLTESMGAAYMLTPRFSVDGIYVDHDKIDIVGQIKKIVTILNPNKACDVEEEFAKYINMISSLPSDKKQLIYQMNAKPYWNVFGKKEFPALFVCASHVFDMVASSAASERVWSAFGFIHSKLRNRLTTDKVEKLISIYVNHAITKQLDAIDSLFADEFLFDNDSD